MTDIQYNQLFDDLGKVLKNQLIICAKLDRLQGDIDVIINNQLMSERQGKTDKTDIVSRLETLKKELNPISRTP